MVHLDEKADYFDIKLVNTFLQKTISNLKTSYHNRPSMKEWNLISFVMASEPRFQILIYLREKVRTPTELTKKMDVPISRTSAVLKELQEKGLVKCLTPKRRKSKMFDLTNKGEKILEGIHELTSKE